MRFLSHKTQNCRFLLPNFAKIRLGRHVITEIKQESHTPSMLSE